MIVPTLVLILAVGAVVAGLLLGWTGFGLYATGAVALVLFLWLSFWPWLTWRTTHYVFTNERIIFQFGVFSRDRRDIPLMRVNDHAMNQTFLERMLGCGTLTIESAGERGQSVLKDIPKVSMVQTRLYELVEHDRDVHSFGDEDRRMPTQAERTEEKQ
jgi:uncharacterized membrane protein YdbT with pleckstrin-like domain